MTLNKWITNKKKENKLGEDIRVILKFLDLNKAILIQEISNLENLNFFIQINKTYFGIQDKRRKKN